jgi:hypothetical protein
MSKHKLLRRFAEDANIVESDVAATDVASEVMDYVEQHRELVFISDKEVPERFGDLRPLEGVSSVDPGAFLVPDTLSGSQQGKDSVTVSNYRVFVKRYAEVEGVFPIRGDQGSFGIAIRISAITAEMLDDLVAIEGYPALDDEEVAKVQHEDIDAAWDDWARYDFIRALEDRFPDAGEMIDGLDDDQTRELFDRIRRSIGADWIEDGGSVFIDVDRVAEGVTLQDLQG